MVLSLGFLHYLSSTRRSLRGNVHIGNLPINGLIADTKLNPSSRSISQSTSSLHKQPSILTAHASQQMEIYDTPDQQKSQKVILLVEDNADIVAYIASCLQDYQLLVATNGAEGLEIAIDAIPDLILSDVMMPFMDGFQMCEKIKQDARTNHIPIVILTAKADLESKIEGLEYATNTYISKPFEKEELVLTIRNLFNLRAKLQILYNSTAKNMDTTQPSDSTLDSPTPNQDEFVEKVRAKIVSRINDFSLSVEYLAQEFHFSQSQFNRKLNALTGLSPVKFMRQIRIEKAKKLLVNPDLSITEIAFDCGFNDPSYFSRVFKKELDESPMEWREKNI